MSAQVAAVKVLRGSPTAEELASLLVVFAALRPGGEREEAPADRRRWGRPAGWHRPQAAVAPDAAGWQRTVASSHERTS